MFILSLLVMLSFSSAQASTSCTSEQTIHENLVASRFLTTGLGCVAQVTPVQKPDLVYREYWIDERGRFMVFNSMAGPDETSTGTRSYFLFPRKRIPAFALKENGDLSFALMSGHEAVFRKEDARLASFPGEFTEAKEISMENNGGLELKSFPGILLDTGWMLGSQAYKKPLGTAIFSDEKNHRCVVLNNEVFFYEEMYYGEPNLRYVLDDRLAEFLQTRCPQLLLDGLR
jgi:hypothetical protein